MKGITAFAVMNDLDDIMIADAIPPAVTLTAGRKRRPRGRLARFFDSPWGVAMICAVVSVGVLTAIIWAGQGGGTTSGNLPGGLPDGIGGLEAPDKTIGHGELSGETTPLGAETGGAENETGEPTELSVVSGHESIEPEKYMLWASIYFDRDNSWAEADGVGATSRLSEIGDSLPTLTYSGGLSVVLPDSLEMRSVELYDAELRSVLNLQPNGDGDGISKGSIRLPDLSNDPGEGTYYVVLGVHWQGRYIEAFDVTEEGYDEYAFRLTVLTQETQYASTDTPAPTPSSVKGSDLLSEGQVIKAHVSSLPEGYEYTFTGASAERIVDYLSNLTLIVSDELPQDLPTGMAWVISLDYDDGGHVTVHHCANSHITIGDGYLYLMDYAEAVRYDGLLAELDKQG